MKLPANPASRSAAKRPSAGSNAKSGRAALIARLGCDFDPARLVGSLAVAHQQVVEIAKALSREVKAIVFAEPKAALPTQDAAMFAASSRPSLRRATSSRSL